MSEKKCLNISLLLSVSEFLVVKGMWESSSLIEKKSLVNGI